MMETMLKKFLRPFVILLLLPIAHAEDSLQGALNAVNRRQRDLSEYRGYGGNYWNEDMTPYDLAKYENRKFELKKALIDYLENQQEFMDDNTVTSPFRERAENAKAYHQKNKLVSNYRDAQKDEDYTELLDKLENSDDPSIYPAYKRSGYNNYNYNSLGLNSVGLRKRRPHSSNLEDGEIYLPYGNDFLYKSTMERRIPYYPVTKRFPVSKRSSSNNHNLHSETKPHHTDPKVERELNQFFSAKQQDEVDKKSSAVTTSKPEIEMTKPTSTHEHVTTTSAIAETQEKPLQMKKKSIKWSDYFGIDRRKKSSNMDNEWLLERYHKAIDMSKKTTESSKHADDEMQATPTQATNSKSRKESIERLDEKLKNLEESIIDDTLKYTGAHDDVDSKEMQEVKDSIISRLATAYNVEKMRKALGEYRQSLERRQREWEQQQLTDGFDGINEEKRVAVARKQAVDEERNKYDVDEDNHIKCTEADENCNEQNYKVPREFMEQATFAKGGCEKIERACKEVSLILGSHGNIFETACNMHQMCMLCSDNSWFSPTRQCNILFLSKADQLCEGNINCQRGARESIKYLQHVNRNIGADLNSDCHLECPDKR